MRRVQKGYTIIEVMIALTLSLLLTAGLTQIFVSNSRTFNVTEASARTQETGRLALSVLSREIRNADYWGCQGTNFLENVVNLLNDDPDFDINSLTEGGLRAENGVGPSGSDRLILGGLAANSAVKVTKQPSVNSASLQVSDPDQFSQNDILIVTNCARAHMFQVTNDPTTGNSQVVIHNEGNVSAGPGNAEKDIEPSYNDNPEGASVFRPRFQRFYLKDNVNTGRRELVIDGIAVLGGAGANLGTYSTTLALFEDVQDFQVELGYRNGPSDVVSGWSAPENAAVSNLEDRTIAVRVSILVRSPDDGVTEGGQSFCYPGWLDCANDANLLTTVDADDTFLYRVYTTTATLRNRI